jgi:hypothetical protein
MTAAVTAAVLAQDDAMRAPITAATVKATDDARRAAARRVAAATDHVDTATHYQTADGEIHPPPPGLRSCGPVCPMLGRQHRRRRP